MAQLHKAIAQLMESRQERPPNIPEPRGMAAVLDGLRARLPADQLSLANSFVEALLAKAPPSDDATAEAASLAAMAAGAFAAFRDRGRAPLAVRVFSPRSERDGWASPLTIVESVMDDRPFIVDTISGVVATAGGLVQQVLHPILGVARDADGNLVEVSAPDAAAQRESFVHLEVANLTASAELQQSLTDHLITLLHVTDDYSAMRARLADTAARLRASPLPRAWESEREELAAWLDQLADHQFVFLGYREYDLRSEAEQRIAGLRADSGLGMLRDAGRSRWLTPAALAGDRARRVDAPPLLIVSKTAVRSPVHRDAPMDDLTIKEVDADGRVLGARRFLGLFTAKSYAEPASEAPLLRRRLATILARAGAIEGSHDRRLLSELFDSFPHEELLASRPEEIHEALRAIDSAEANAESNILVRPDGHGRGYFVLVILPRARFSTDLQTRVTAAIERALGGPVLLAHLGLDDRAVVRLHYHVLTAGESLAAPLETLRVALGDLLRTWDDSLRDALARGPSATDSVRLVERYAAALPAAYKAATDPRDGARDLRNIDALLTGGREQIEWLQGPPDTALVLKLYVADTPLALSDFVPILEHFGLRVLDQDIVQLKPVDGRHVALHQFTVQPTAAHPLDLGRVGDTVIAALLAVRAGLAADDRLNALITTLGMSWRTVAVLRAYADHAHQSAVGTRQSIVDALVANPQCASALAAWFSAKFDPAASTLSPAQRLAGPAATAEQAVSVALAAVPSLAHDRVLRALAASIGATVRTNAYAIEPPAALALKLDASRIPHLPAPRPQWETWVHGLALQGIHLRSDSVARGGIRFSDRPDDFRAEILALMRTQVVKNAVIVPGGAKGGFVLPAALTGDPARVAAGYRDFIDALLSITDNRERGSVTAPRNVLRYDGDDPYLVVAADKGTAAFSDLANQRATERGFWLGDAFASGGSQGYDHKALGITARGAWESARQHFREMDRDLEREAVTVVGIGDMSGDVFGNGLLRSRHLRLVAAFDHRHIFLDPTPDAERAMRERERLFALPRSSWADYSPAALSVGGGTYARDAKTIALSAEALRLLGLEDSSPSGEAVVRAILRLQADLLWNGGIGTYVKATQESHADVGDSANDAVRIDAAELRAAVVVEGGNLGLTQAARIEYGLAGGRINSDAIDNSGGVDCSDHEVNLKIALRPLVDNGELSLPARQALLAELPQPVCSAVLANNRSQARALAHDQVRSRTQLAAFRDLLTILESEAGLDRQLAQLPTREALRLRRGLYLGLTRPELAVLLANTKLDLRRRITPSPLLDEPELESLLYSYFPASLAASHPGAIRRHPLRREIIALSLTNQLIDTMGMTFLVRAVRDSGHDVLDVVRAWLAVLQIADAGAVQSALAAIHERLSESAAQRTAFMLAEGLERATMWLVTTRPPGQSLAATLEVLRAPVGEVLDVWEDVLPPERRDARSAEIAALASLGIPNALATSLSGIAVLDQALEIAYLARRRSVPSADAAASYMQIGSLLGLDWLAQALTGALAGEDRWEPRAAAGLVEGLRHARRHLTIALLESRRSGDPIDTAVSAFAHAHHEQTQIVAGLISDLKAATQPSLPALLVVMHELGRLARQRSDSEAW